MRLARSSYAAGMAAWLAGIVLAASGAHAGETAIAGSWELRGGYDSNPPLALGAAGTVTAGYSGSVALAHRGEGYVAGATLEAGATHYLRGTLDASRTQKAELSFATTDEGRALVEARAGIENTRTYDTIFREAVTSLKVKSRNPLVRPFVTAELAVFELNESNVLVGDFLPRAQVALRGTLIPGIERQHGAATIGVSVSLTVIRYRDPVDLFGFARDNERVQPFFYVEAARGGWQIFGAVSILYGDWHEPFFTDLAEFMFEAQASYEGEGWRASLDASRRAVETTFPVSPVTIDTSVTASVSRDAGAHWRLGLTGSYHQTRYPDSPFRTRTVSLALDASREIRDDVVLGLKVGAARSWPWSGGVADGVFSQVSVSRAFAERPLRPGI